MKLPDSAGHLVLSKQGFNASIFIIFSPPSVDFNYKVPRRGKQIINYEAKSLSRTGSVVSTGLKGLVTQNLN